MLILWYKILFSSTGREVFVLIYLQYMLFAISWNTSQFWMRIWYSTMHLSTLMMFLAVLFVPYNINSRYVLIRLRNDNTNSNYLPRDSIGESKGKSSCTYVMLNVYKIFYRIIELLFIILYMSKIYISFRPK